jgi:hypothetical protein
MARQEEQTAGLIQPQGGAEDGALRSLLDLRSFGEGGGEGGPSFSEAGL